VSSSLLLFVCHTAVLDFNFETYLVLKESWEKTFTKFKDVFPELEKSEETFRQYCSIFAKISERKTDICQICALYHRLMKQTSLSEKEKTQMEVCVAHRNLRDSQRESHDSQIEKMENGECQWTFDYGQNKSVKKKPEEDSFDFFNKMGISVQGNVILFKFNDVLYKKIVCFYSVHTAHTAQTSIDLFDRILDYNEFKYINKINLWSDGGLHHAYKRQKSGAQQSDRVQPVL
jgi:hypothetical protein